MPVHDHIHHPAPDTPASPDTESGTTPATAAPTDTAPATETPAPAVPAPAPVAAEPETLAAWAALGPAFADHACILADRDDLLVTLRPEGTSSGAPAQFTPATATIDLDAKIFRRPPTGIRPHRPGDEHRYPAAYGALTHEAAHARHSRWLPDPDTPPAVAHAAELLEESRIEHRHITRRPADRAFLRACALDLVRDEITATPPDGPYAAATAAALILGRETAGILEPEETAAVRAAATSLLGTETLADLERIWSAAHRLDDEDTAGLLALGKAWTDRVHKAAGKQPSTPGADETGEVGGAEERPEAAPEPGPGVLAAAIADTTRAVAHAITAEHPAAPADPEEAASRTAESVFRKHGRGARGRRGPIRGTRPPTPQETAAAGALARALRAAAYRERTLTIVRSELPPGRLNMRGALTRDAQKAAGAMPTAKPFTQTRRHAVPTPPLRVGIAVDVSSSMADATGPIASAAWILARATTLTDPLSASATLAFGDKITPITHPGPAPAHVTVFAAPDGWERPATAIDALDGALHLTRPGAARLLILVTDGMFVDPEENKRLPDQLARLAASGCALMHLAFSRHGRAIPHTQLALVPDPAAAIDAISKAATAALRAAR